MIQVFIYSHKKFPNKNHIYLLFNYTSKRRKQQNIVSENVEYMLNLSLHRRNSGLLDSLDGLWDFGFGFVLWVSA